MTPLEQAKLEYNLGRIRSLVQVRCESCHAPVGEVYATSQGPLYLTRMKIRNRYFVFAGDWTGKRKPYPHHKWLYHLVVTDGLPMPTLCERHGTFAVEANRLLEAVQQSTDTREVVTIRRVE